MYADAGTAADAAVDRAQRALAPTTWRSTRAASGWGWPMGIPTARPARITVWSAVDGALQWSYGTANMSWPIRLNSDATVVVGGSDDSTVTAFVGPGSAIGRGRSEADG